jgi:hypothetical protein
MGLSIAKLWRVACWQKVDFPDPGGPANKTIFPSCASCNCVRDKNIPINKFQSLLFTFIICYNRSIVAFFTALHGAGDFIGGILGVIVLRGLEARRVIQS